MILLIPRKCYPQRQRRDGEISILVKQHYKCRAILSLLRDTELN